MKNQTFCKEIADSENLRYELLPIADCNYVNISVLAVLGIVMAERR